MAVHASAITAYTAFDLQSAQDQSKRTINAANRGHSIVQAAAILPVVTWEVVPIRSTPARSAGVDRMGLLEDEFCPDPDRERNYMTNEEKKVQWLNDRDPLNKWSVGEDVYCLHCDGVFKAEDVGKDTDGLPECPRCGATPLDFAGAPWWREDLVEEKTHYSWLVQPIRATPGQPGQLPPSSTNRN